VIIIIFKHVILKFIIFLVHVIILVSMTMKYLIFFEVIKQMMQIKHIIIFSKSQSQKTQTNPS
jgi:hypothetical protein